MLMIRVAGSDKVTTCPVSSMALTVACTLYENGNTTARPHINSRKRFISIFPTHTRALMNSVGGVGLNQIPHRPPQRVSFDYSRPVSGLVSGPYILAEN